MTSAPIPWKQPNEYEQWWLDQDGKEIVVEEHRYTVRSNWRPIRYPTATYRLDVVAIPTLAEQQTEWYRSIKANLGDDWMTDLLSVDTETFNAIAKQLTH